MALMTKDQYLDSLRGLDHWVCIQGEKVRSVPDHPMSGPPAMAMAEHRHTLWPIRNHCQESEIAFRVATEGQTFRPERPTVLRRPG
jgi:aromatic ring hydroxylase